MVQKNGADVYLKYFILHLVLQIILMISVPYLEDGYFANESLMMWPLLLTTENTTIMPLFMIIAIFKFGCRIKQIILLFTIFSSIALSGLVYYSNFIELEQYPALFITKGIFLVGLCSLIKIFTLCLKKGGK